MFRIYLSKNKESRVSNIPFSTLSGSSVQREVYRREGVRDPWASSGALYLCRHPIEKCIMQELWVWQWEAQPINECKRSWPRASTSAHHYLYSHLVYSVNALFLWTNRHLIAALVDIMQVVFSAEEISLYAL